MLGLQVDEQKERGSQNDETEKAKDNIICMMWMLRNLQPAPVVGNQVSQVQMIRDTFVYLWGLDCSSKPEYQKVIRLSEFLQQK